MLSNFPASLALVLKSEGKFSNDARDPGGMTMLGVTKLNWETWVKRSVDEAEMRSLTPELVAPMYKAKYWDACKCDSLPLGIDYAVFDFAVNAGVSRAAKTLQKALGVTADGAIGPKTIAAATEYPAGELLEVFTLAKEAFYQSLPTFPVFGKGWLNRVAHVQDAAEQMIGA
jgi:lysozyme family protein